MPARTVQQRRAQRVARAKPAARVDTTRTLPWAGTRPESLSAEDVLSLQRQVGNAAVGELLNLVQRDPAPLSTADDPEGYTQKAGVANVKKSGTTRREVHGLKFGVTGGFQKSYWSNFYKKDLSSEESQMTKESPDNMAVVIMPDKLDKRPVQIILHFAGWGFRDGDPFAGYLVARGPKRPKGSVRDVDQEHWEQQIGAINQARTTGPQTIAILAQGRGMSDFGNVPTFDYIKDVLSHVSELSGVSQYSLILSAHSGGGGTQISPKVKSGQAQTRDRSKLPKAAAGSAAPQPTDMVVMFDAEGSAGVTGWATNQIDQLTATIKSVATAAEADKAIADTPKFRGYFALNGNYDAAFRAMHKKICDAILKVPIPFGVPDPSNLTRVTVSDLFRVVPVPGVDHEHVISAGSAKADDAAAKKGSIADALLAEADPTVDRAAGLPCEAPKPKPKPKPKARAKAKSKAQPDQR